MRNLLILCVIPLFSRTQNNFYLGIGSIKTIANLTEGSHATQQENRDFGLYYGNNIKLSKNFMTVLEVFYLNFRNLKALTNHGTKGVQISPSKGVIYSILTGITVTMYSYVDKLGVDEINPVQYFYIYMAITFIIYNFNFFLKKENVYSDFFKKKNLFEYSFVGLSDSLSYLLILFTLTFTNLSYVAPMRNSGIVTSSLFGLIYLNEKFYKSRLIGSILIFVGIIIITIGIK